MKAKSDVLYVISWKKYQEEPPMLKFFGTRQGLLAAQYAIQESIEGKSVICDLVPACNEDEQGPQ